MPHELSRRRVSKSDVHLELHLAAMEELPFPDNYFDAVLSCQALHHVPKDAKFTALKEMQRILKPGGRLLLLDHGKPYGGT